MKYGGKEGCTKCTEIIIQETGETVEKEQNNIQGEVLAYRIYPLPNGTYYHGNDLSEEEDVKRLFDYCKILEATIFQSGWEFMINKFGYECLFSINEKSGWLDSEDIEEFRSDIEELKDQFGEIQFLEPWYYIESNGDLEIELHKELSIGHVLYGEKLKAIAKREDNDDVLFIGIGKEPFVAEVHLTWSGKKEADLKWPKTLKSESIDLWIQKRMVPANRDFEA